MQGEHSAMKLIMVLFTILVVSNTGAQESIVERYVELNDAAIFDPNVSNEAINLLLCSGIDSQNPTIFRLTLIAINSYSERRSEEETRPLASLPHRSISQIPGLKEKLIDHWREEHAKHGYSVSEYVRNLLRSEDVQALVQSALADRAPTPDQVEQTISEIVEQRIREISPWVEILGSLCVLWPQDDAVHSLIWEFREQDRAVDPANLLRLLNRGKFVTQAANRYRISQLVAYPMGSGSGADQAISLAARGLALSHPEDAIADLVEAGFNHIEPRADVLITLAGYEDTQLDPFYSKLVSLVSAADRSSPLDEPYARALNRLVPYVNRRDYSLRPLEFSKSTEDLLAGDDHHQRFSYLRNGGILNPQISDETVIAMLTEGINHNDVDVVEQTLRTLIDYSGAIAMNEHMDRSDHAPRRPIQLVPNLKGFLTERFRESQSQAGFDSDLSDFKSLSEGVLSSDLDISIEKFKGLMPLQDGILMALCRFWPKDRSVHSLVWEYHKDNPLLPASQTLALLNNGRFDTIEANNYRISQLNAYAQESGPLGDYLTTIAAQGLTLSHPEKAIPALIKAGTETDHRESRGAVLITLSGYNKTQLEPYQSELSPMVNVSRNSLPFNQEIQTALDRLSVIVNE